MPKPPKDFLDLLRKYDRGVQELVFALRDVILDELAPCFETMLEVYMISICVQRTDYEGHICYIGVLKDRLNLGFHQGARLRDPYRLMEGTSKQMRHIKIRSMADALHPAIRAYLQEARERAGHDIPFDKARTVTLAVKRKSAAKRVVGTTRL